MVEYTLPTAWSVGHEEIFKELRERSVKWRTRKKKSEDSETGKEDFPPEE